MRRRVRSLRVNGVECELDVDAERPLLEVLRDHLDLTGAKLGCGEGRCGACTVLVDGEPVHSCILKVGTVEGKSVTTIEGLTPEQGLHPLQAAFLEHNALQCGFCTPGMILGGFALLSRVDDPTELEIIDGMKGHICRCGAYPRIVEAIKQVARELRKEPS